MTTGLLWNAFEKLFGFPQSDFVEFAIRNIFGDGQCTRFSFNFHHFRREPANPTIPGFRMNFNFEIAILSGGDDRFYRLLHPLRIGPKSELPVVMADDFLAQIARDRFEGFVDVDNAMIQEG